jgi:hypothetical protein
MGQNMIYTNFARTYVKSIYQKWINIYHIEHFEVDNTKIYAVTIQNAYHQLTEKFNNNEEAQKALDNFMEAI